MIAAIISAISNALENIFDKLILKEKGIDHRVYLSISITFIFILASIVNIFFGGYKQEFFTPNYLLLFGGMIFCAFFFNILFFWALSKEDLCDVEPFVLLDRPFTVLMAAAFFPSERNIVPLIFAIIATVTLVLSRLERHHLKIRKTTLALMGFILLIAIESIFVKLLLEVISPVTLYMFRTGILTLLFWTFLHPNISKVKIKDYSLIAMNSVLTVIQFIGRFYAILYIGIVQTNLLLLLGPVLALIFTKTFLKENLTAKKAFADVIIVLCVIAVMLIN